MRGITNLPAVLLAACAATGLTDKGLDTDRAAADPDCATSGAEVCDGVDNDCDGVVDPGCVDDTGARTETGADTDDRPDSDAVDTDTDTGEVFVPAECEGVNTAAVGDDLTMMGGPGLLVGFAYTPVADVEVGHVDVWTGEDLGPNAIALWTHNAALQQPEVLIASGTWSMVAANGWQGADLDRCVALHAGVTYWVVWSPVEGSQASFATSGTPVTYRGSFNGGATWNGPWTGYPMFDLVCCG